MDRGRGTKASSRPLVDDAFVDGFGDEDRSEARRILYALDAILRLHFAQEEELLMSITLDGPPGS